MNKSMKEQLEIVESIPIEILVDPQAIQEAFIEEDSYRARVRLIQACVSKNGNWYTEDVLREATPLFEGVPSFVDHKDLKDRSARDKIGDFTGSAFEGNLTGNAIMSDFNVYPGTGKWLWENMKAAPHSVQLSIKAKGLSERVKHPQSGQTVNKVSRLTAVESVDVVALAAAGGGVVGLLREGIKEDTKVAENVTLEELKIVDRLRAEFKGELERESELNKLRDEIKAFGDFKESLAKAGFETVDTVIAKLAESVNESKGLKDKIAQYELEKRIAEKESMVQRLVKGDKDLKDEYVDPQFIENLRALPDEAAVKDAITARVKLIHTVEAKVRGNGPEPEKKDEKKVGTAPTDDELIAKLKR